MKKPRTKKNEDFCKDELPLMVRLPLVDHFDGQFLLEVIHDAHGFIQKVLPRREPQLVCTCMGMRIKTNVRYSSTKIHKFSSRIVFKSLCILPSFLLVIILKKSRIFIETFPMAECQIPGSSRYDPSKFAGVRHIKIMRVRILFDVLNFFLKK